MSLEVEQIKEQFESFSGRFGPKVIVPATVIAVNDDDTIHVQFSDGSEVDDCRLKAVVMDGNKALLVPVVSSVVLVGKIENSEEYIVLAVHAVSEILYLIGSTKFKLDSSGFLLQKGTDTLKEIIQLQIEAMQQIVVIYGNSPNYAKLTQAAQKLNNLLQ